MEERCLEELRRSVEPLEGVNFDDFRSESRRMRELDDAWLDLRSVRLAEDGARGGDMEEFEAFATSRDDGRLLVRDCLSRDALRGRDATRRSSAPPASLSIETSWRIFESPHTLRSLLCWSMMLRRSVLCRELLLGGAARCVTSLVSRSAVIGVGAGGGGDGVANGSA